MSKELEDRYLAARFTVSDINEHIQVLAEYAAQCSYVLELGVRSCVSSWALLKGLRDNGSAVKCLLAVDLHNHPNTAEVARVARDNGIGYAFLEGNDLLLHTDPVDLTFIDTWHVYAQLKRELAKFSPLTRKYIIMHDTEVDGQLGESIRLGFDVEKQARQTGFPEHEIRKGLVPAIHEFLSSNPDWVLDKHFSNNNGLTVLRRT